MIASIKKYLMDNWYEVGLPGTAPRDVTFIQVSSSLGKKFNRERIIYLIFLPGKKEPIITAKICRDESYAYHLVNEHNNLTSLFEQHGPIVPQPIARVEIDSKVVTFERAARGVGMDIRMKNFFYSAPDEKSFSAYVSRDFTLASKLLAGFDTANQPASAGAYPREIRTMMRIFCNSYQVDDGLRRQFEDRAETIISQPGRREFSRLVQFDFTPSNVIVDDKGNAAVIDWEVSGNSSMLFLEPARFIVYYWKTLYDIGYFGHNANDARCFGETVLNRRHWLGHSAFDFMQLPQTESVTSTEEDMLGKLFLFYIYEALLNLEYTERMPRQRASDFIRFVRLLAHSSVESFMHDALREEHELLLAKNRAKLEENEHLREERHAVFPSPFQKLAAQLHNLRMKIPFINKIKR